MAIITPLDREAARGINGDQDQVSRVLAEYREKILENAARLVEAMSVEGPGASPWDAGRAFGYRDAALKIRALKGGHEHLH